MNTEGCVPESGEQLLTITEMAQIHKISRQTLIHYDKIGLFQPKVVDSNGYRFYTVTQIPHLREICFLKALGLRLETIKGHIQNRSHDSAIELLQSHLELLNDEIRDLTERRRAIQDRIAVYQSADVYNDQAYMPTIEYFEERRVLFFPWEGPMCRETLHLTVMKGWRQLLSSNTLPSSGFGAILFRDQLLKGDVLKGAGGYVNVPERMKDVDGVRILPEGEYICVCKYSMPYEIEHLYTLVDWIKNNGYEIIGDIVDECLLDTTFYDSQRKTDFSQLQIPVKKL
jgi:DNA-binding transcriptional MerR regulator